MEKIKNYEYKLDYKVFDIINRFMLVIEQDYYWLLPIIICRTILALSHKLAILE